MPAGIGMVFAAWCRRYGEQAAGGQKRRSGRLEGGARERKLKGIDDNGTRGRGCRACSSPLLCGY